MRGLSVVLEAGERVVNNNNNNNSNSPQVINKFSVMKPQPQPQPEPQPQPPPSYYYYNSNFPFSTAFLEHCFLCKKKLLPDFDIYMYDGDKAFCSMECRYTQIYMDERDKKVPREESTLTAIMPHFYISSSPPTPPSSAAAGAGPSSSSSSSSNRRGAGNGANGFGY